MPNHLLGPVILPLGDAGVTVNFGDSINDAIHTRVIELDRIVQANPPPGFTELIPSYCALFVGYDPLKTDFLTISTALKALFNKTAPKREAFDQWTISACYDDDFGIDLKDVAHLTKHSLEAVIALHLGAAYRVYMYGFAPGYAYLGGVPGALQLPRKDQPVRDVPAGSILIAGQQCLVTTITMPSGWWIIGRSPTQLLQPGEDNPFMLGVGDSVTFSRIHRSQYDTLTQQS